MVESKAKTISIGWLVLSVGVQSAIGAGMVPVRYLQTVAGLPALALVALTDLVAFSIMSWQVIPKIDRRYWRSKTLWLLVVIVVLRTICLTFAARFTRVYIVQLISLLAPFLVYFLNRIFMNEPLPKYTVPSILLCLVGGVMMVFGGLAHQTIDLLLTPRDYLGILFAFLGTFGIAAYMLIVKRSDHINLPYEIVYISQIGTMMVLMAVLSLMLGEDWSPFIRMDWRAILAFLFIALGLEIGGKIGNIATLRKLGAPLVSSMLATRLVAALLVGWFVLGERLTSWMQWMGVVIVIVTVTGFIYNLNRSELRAIDIEV